MKITRKQTNTNMNITQKHKTNIKKAQTTQKQTWK